MVQEAIKDSSGRRHIVRSLPQSSKGRLLGMIVERFSYRRRMTSRRYSPDSLAGL